MADDSSTPTPDTSAASTPSVVAAPAAPDTSVAPASTAAAPDTSTMPASTPPSPQAVAQQILTRLSGGGTTAVGTTATMGQKISAGGAGIASSLGSGGTTAAPPMQFTSVPKPSTAAYAQFQTWLNTLHGK